MQSSSGVLSLARTTALRLLRASVRRVPAVARVTPVRRVVVGDLDRRLASPRTRTGAVRDASDLVRASDRTTVLAVLEVAGRHGLPEVAAGALAAGGASRTDDGGLTLALARAARAADDPERASALLDAAVVAPAHRPGVTALVTEALLQHRTDVLGGLVAAGPATRPDGSVDPAARAALTLAGDLLPRLQDGQDVRPLLLDRLDDPLVAGLAPSWLDESSPASAWQAVGHALLAATETPGTGAGTGTRPDDEALRAAARGLRAAGDFSISSTLARRVAGGRAVDMALGGMARTGETNLTTLREGWSPPPRAERGLVPRSRAVEMLLHGSLPHSSVGYSTRSHGLLTALRGDGWDVRATTRPGFPYDVLPDDAPDVAGDDVVDGVSYHRLLDGRRRFAAWPADGVARDSADRLVPHLLTSRPGIVHAASNFRVGMGGITAARRLGLPAVYEVRGLWEYTRSAREPEFADSELFALTARLEADVCRAADRVLVITAALGARLVERGVDPASIVVVPNGVDVDRFTPAPRDTELAHRLGLGDRTVVGYIGSLLEYEGLELLVEAAATLRREREDFAVLVVGEGRSLPALRRAVDEAGLAGTVVFTGRVGHGEVERYYSLVDVAPFPRLGVEVCELVSPLKPFEAMAMEKPVVVSDVAAMTEVVTDGVTGRVFAKGSAQALADVLRDLLDSPDQRARLAAAGRAWVRQERDWSAISATVTGVYAELWDEFHPDVPLDDA